MSKEKIFGMIFFIFLVVFSFKSLLPAGYFTMHDDLQVGRLYQMDLCVKDGQIPCRWVPDMGYGYGYPLFNFYPPLPYYVGEILHLSGFSFLDSIKILFILGLIFSGLFAYLLGKELWGKYGGFVVGIFYLYAPYHAVDVYVRGALNEFFGLIFLPAVFWAGFKIIKEGKSNYCVFSAIFFGCLLLSHNLIAFFVFPALLLWFIFLIWYFKKPFVRIFYFFLSLVWGVGMAAFFSFPVIFEQKYVHIDTMFMGYFNYLAHFATVDQLFFSRFWGYGASLWGSEDGMSFAIGQIHWLTGAIAFILFTFLWFKKRKREFFLISLFFLLFLGYAFLSHQRSSFVWEIIPILATVQFPWRFVGISSFFVTLLSGSFFILIRDLRKARLVTILMVIMVLSFNLSFFQPEKILNTTDEEKLFSAKGWNKLQTDAIFDYLPIYAKEPPTKPAPNSPLFIEGTGEILNFQKGTDWEQFSAESVVHGSIIQTPLYDFPGMKVWVNGKETPINHDNFLGLISFEVPQGESKIKVKLTNTPVRFFSNIISFASWSLLLGYVFKQTGFRYAKIKKWKSFRK